MAGFVENSNTGGSNPFFKGIAKSLKKLSNLGMEYEDEVIKQSKAVGATEAEVGGSGYMPIDHLYSLSMSDIGQKKFIAYFEREYEERRDYLRRFAMNGEIDYITETIADEAIVYDENDYFCRVNTSQMAEFLDDDNAKKIQAAANQRFKKIYNTFHFKESHDAWHYFKKFLIDGFLAFEIIFDEEGTEIIGFKEIDPFSIRPGVKKMEDGSYKKIWVQYEDNPSLKRELLDTSIIYISYAKSNFVGRISYVERLVRSFNLLRILENSRIIWNIMNSSFRLKMVVPIGTKSPTKAKQSLSEMLNIYKEDIDLNFDSGELTINGKPTMQFYKNYLFPSKNGESPDISVMGGEGPDLSDTRALEYFYKKLRKDSKLPSNRFDFENPGTVSFRADGESHDEIRFSKFINRLRTIYQEILLKPLWVQLCLDFPELANDQLVKSNLSLKFNAENIFEELKQMELMEKRANFIGTMGRITTPELDDNGRIENIQYFDASWLVNKYMQLTPGELKDNEKRIKERNKKWDKKREEMKDDGGGGGGSRW